MVQLLFDLSNFLVLPCWILLLLAPRTKVAELVFRNEIPMFLIALFYAGVIIPGLVQDSSVFSSLSKPTFEGVAALLSTPTGTAAAWIHFIAFDMFVGNQVRKRAIERGHSFYWVSPILYLVLMFGPLGYLLFSVSSRVLLGLRQS